MVGLALKVGGVCAAVYVVAVALAWRHQERLAFPSPRMPLPEPTAAGLPAGRRVTLETADGVRIYGWYLPPSDSAPRPAPALLWFVGNMETVGGLAPVLGDWKPPEFGLLAVDYRGYGESEGAATEAGLYRDADAAWAYVTHLPEIDARRIAVYGRSLGSAVALYLATERPARAVVLDSPFSSAAAMARHHYWFLPPMLVRLSLDNVGRAARLTVPLLVVHGSDDRIAPIAMGRAVAAAGHARDFLAVPGAGHNETYLLGGHRYRDLMITFLRTAM
jgi:pimeloyl-ACP methyl ester carboxylesterase